MELRFDFEKSLQAAAYLLHLEEGRMPYLRLLKLMYIAERELLAQTASPLTGDSYRALEDGPVLNRVFNLIGGDPDTHFSRATNKRHRRRPSFLFSSRPSQQRN
jgi:uncharacterized phage-associated protein